MLFFQPLAQLAQSDSRFNSHRAGVGVDAENAVEVIEVHEPGGGTGEIGGRVGAANGNKTAATTAGEGNQLLDLGNRVRANVELWSREEGLGPSVMKVIGRCAERDRGVELGQLAWDTGVHDCDMMEVRDARRSRHPVDAITWSDITEVGMWWGKLREKGRVGKTLRKKSSLMATSR